MTDLIANDWLAGQIGRRVALSDAAVEAIGALTLTTRAYEPTQYILREGDRPRVCSFLQAGFVHRHKIVGDGGRQIVAIHIPGDFVDVQNILLAEADHNVQALTAATLVSVPQEELVALSVAEPAIAGALWREALVESSITREWVANIGRRDARARIAHLLCELATRREAAGIGPRATFDLPMTQEQFGDALGLTSVHVNRTLKALESEGLITRSKRSVTVADWPGLQRVADFTSTYLHLQGASR